MKFALAFNSVFFFFFFFVAKEKLTYCWVLKPINNTLKVSCNLFPYAYKEVTYLIYFFCKKLKFATNVLDLFLFFLWFPRISIWYAFAFRNFTTFKNMKKIKYICCKFVILCQKAYKCIKFFFLLPKIKKNYQKQT